MHVTPASSLWHPFFFNPSLHPKRKPSVLSPHAFLLLLLAPRVLSWVSAVRNVGRVPEETAETAAGRGPRCEPTQVAGP